MIPFRFRDLEIVKKGVSGVGVNFKAVERFSNIEKLIRLIFQKTRTKFIIEMEPSTWTMALLILMMAFSDVYTWKAPVTEADTIDKTWDERVPPLFGHPSFIRPFFYSYPMDMYTHENEEIRGKFWKGIWELGPKWKRMINQKVSDLAHFVARGSLIFGEPLWMRIIDGFLTWSEVLAVTAPGFSSRGFNTVEMRRESQRGRKIWWGKEGRKRERIRKGSVKGLREREIERGWIQWRLSTLYTWMTWIAVYRERAILTRSPITLTSRDGDPLRYRNTMK